MLVSMCGWVACVLLIPFRWFQVVVSTAQSTYQGKGRRRLDAVVRERASIFTLPARVDQALLLEIAVVLLLNLLLVEC